MAKGPGNNALQLFYIYFPDHRMGLATASLAIGKYRPIIPQQYILDQAIGSFGIDELLGGVFIKDMIESERFSIVGIVEFDETNLVVLLVGLDDRVAVALLLFCVHWTDPHHHLDCLAHL
jgi:hypothetical protein